MLKNAMKPFQAAFKKLNMEIQAFHVSLFDAQNHFNGTVI